MNPIIKEMPGEALRKSMEQTRHSLVMQAVIKP